jgi:hypothetical protein
MGRCRESGGGRNGQFNLRTEIVFAPDGELATDKFRTFAHTDRGMVVDCEIPNQAGMGAHDFVLISVSSVPFPENF